MSEQNKTTTPLQHSAEELFSILAVATEVLQVHGHQILVGHVTERVMKHQKVIKEISNGR